MADPIATAADYADAIMTARRAKNTLFLFLLLILIVPMTLFFLGRNKVLNYGGAEVSVERLQFFEVWRGLRNAALAANVLYDVQHGTLAGLEMAAIAVNTYPRLEAQLAASLAKVIGA